MNIYQTAREAQGITQEKAAELLGISVESLRAYECGRRLPPTAVVVGMVDVYNTQFLAYQHLKQDSIADSLLPDICEKTMAEAVLSLIKEIADTNDLIPTLISIASDGVIDKNELEAWEKIKKEFSDVVQSYYCLIISDKAADLGR